MDRAPDLTWDTCDFEDEHDQEFGWECLTDALTEFIGEVHPDGDWYVTVENFGWMNQSGHAEITAEDGQKLLQEVLPKTECTFKIWLDKEKKTIRIDNAHHDKPTGGEIYVIRPVPEDECTVCQEDMEGESTCHHCIKDLPQDKFNDALEKALEGVTANEILFSVPGIYEILSEEYNNEALDIAYARLVEEHEAKDKAAWKEAAKEGQPEAKA